MSYGDWEGHTREEIGALFPENWARYQADPAAERPSHGETRAELHARVVGALLDILAESAPGGQILLAAHGGTLRAIVAEVLGLALSGYRYFHFDNASLSILDLRLPAGPEGRASGRPSGLNGAILLLDDTAHLEPVKGSSEWLVASG
jgi:broad specificity phosphatase PhoE